MRRLFLDLSLALRTILRQRRRSAFALAAIAFGVAALMLAAGFIDWNFLHYREAMIRSQLGHIQIHRAGFTQSGGSDSLAFLMPDRSGERDAIERMPAVSFVASRLSVSGLVSHGDATVPFIAEGIDPKAAAQMSEAVLMSAGAPLAHEDPEGVLLGQGLAENLQVVPGDRVTLVVNTPSGGINASDAHVRGVFRSVSKAYDDVALRVPISMAQRLLRVVGSDTLVVMLDDTAATPGTVDALRALLNAGGYEVVPWWTLSDFYNKSSELFARQVAVIKVIIGCLIVLSISNTLMMSVMERTGEIGTTMALGARRRDVLRQFVTEGFVLGMFGALLGLAIGYLLAAVVSTIGIPVPPPPGMSHGYTGRILVTPELAASAAVLALATTLIAALYPAWKASRMVIVDALRRNRA